MYTKETFRYNGHDYSYAVSGEGRPIIFLCGWGVPCPLADFWSMITRLRDRYRCIVIDRLGYGDSDEGVENDFNGFLSSFIETLGLERVILVGHSLGTLYALRFAASGGAVERVVLIDSYPVDGMMISINLASGRSLGKARKSGKLDRLSDEYLLGRCGVNYELPDELRAEAVRSIRERLYNDSLLNELDAFRGGAKRLMDSLSSITAEVVCLCSPMTRAKNEQYSKRIKNCRVVFIKKTSHFIHHDHEDLTLKAITE